LIEKGHSVLFAPTFALVQDLLLAKDAFAVCRPHPS
jgi:hypothetical protein